MIIKEHFVSLLGPAAGRVARLARISVLLYAFALPFTHNAAIKNVALLGMLIALVTTIRERQLKLDLRSPVLASVFTVMAVAQNISLVSVAGPCNMAETRPVGTHVRIIQRSLPCAHIFCAPNHCRVGTLACIRDIGAAEIVAAIDTVLERTDT